MVVTAKIARMMMDTITFGIEGRGMQFFSLDEVEDSVSSLLVDEDCVKSKVSGRLEQLRLRLFNLAPFQAVFKQANYSVDRCACTILLNYTMEHIS